jgi:hypothetical protein
MSAPHGIREQFMDLFEEKSSFLGSPNKLDMFDDI